MTENKKPSVNATDDFIRLQDLWGMFVPRWHWFALSLLATLSLAALYLLSTPNIYTRSASILVKDDSKGGGAGAAMSEFSDMDIFKSNTNINNELFTLKSPELMAEVVRRLKLDETYTVKDGLRRVELYRSSPVVVTLLRPTGMPASLDISLDGKSRFTVTDLETGQSRTLQSGDSIRITAGTAVITASTTFPESLLGETVRYGKGSVRGAADGYAAALRAELGDKNATIINLSIDNASPRKAEDILNTLIEVYNEKWIQDKNQIAVSTSQFIGDRLSVIESELGNVDENISNFKSQHLIPDVQAASSMYFTQSAEHRKELLALNNQLSTARYIRRELETKPLTQPLPANSGISNANIEGQIGEYNTLVLDRNRLIDNSSERNPLVVDLANSLESLKRTILQSVDNLIVSLDTEIQGIRRQEAATTSQLASNPNQAKYLLSVERQQKVKEELYLYLLQKREENELSQAFTAYNTRVITAPRGSMVPTSPVKRNILLVAFALGLLIPGGVIFLMESMNTKIRGRKDLENLSVPFIGEIPLYGKADHPSLRRMLFGRKKKTDKEEDTSIIVKEGSRNIINEAFRVLRSNIDFMAGKDRTRNVMVVTSFNPGSGKSFLVVNIATSFVLKGKKVLLIDGDMRHGSSSVHAGKPDKGLSGYLAGRTDKWQDLLCPIEGREGLHILPVGTVPPNPTELLENGRLERLVSEVRGAYDYVFIDCPPIDIVADAQIIEKLADRTIFVVRAGLMDRSMLTDLESMYQDRRFKNMSLILNGTESATGRYGYRYGYKYGYRYGYHNSYATSYYSKN